MPPIEAIIEFLDANFIVLLCFLLFMFFSLRFGYHKAISALDNQIGEIKKTLDEAQNKFTTAQEKLKETKTSQAKLSLDVEKLIDEANHQIETMKSQSEEEIKKLIDCRQETVDQMIDQIRLKAINDLKITLSTQIQAVLEDVMLHRLDGKTHEQLNQDAIDKLTLALKDQSTPTDIAPKKRKSSGADSSGTADLKDSPLLANGL